MTKRQPVSPETALKFKAVAEQGVRLFLKRASQEEIEIILTQINTPAHFFCRTIGNHMGGPNYVNQQFVRDGKKYLRESRRNGSRVDEITVSALT